MPVIKRQRAIADSDIPAPIARDTEYIAADASHLAATDPHIQYLLQSEGDTRYRQTATALYTAQPLPTASLAGNSIAISWNSVQPGNGIGELCNYAGLGGGDAFNFFRMQGNSAATPTISHRVSRIDVNGAYIQTSDKRVKSNFVPAPGLAAILALTPLKYKHWNCVGFDEKLKTLKLGTNYTDKIGFLAQDVQKIIPEGVSIPESETELLGIDYSVIFACAVKAIQELEVQVQHLRSQVAEITKK